MQHGAIGQGQQIPSKLNMRQDEDTDMEPANAEENEDFDEAPRGQPAPRNQPMNN